MELVGDSIFRQLRQLDIAFVQLMSADMAAAEPAGRRAFEALRRHLRLAQALARDYAAAEIDDDTPQRLKLLPKLVREIEQVRAAILKLSEYNMVSAIDVAQHTAQLDVLLTGLR